MVKDSHKEESFFSTWERVIKAQSRTTNKMPERFEDAEMIDLDVTEACKVCISYDSKAEACWNPLCAKAGNLRDWEERKGE